MYTNIYIYIYVIYIYLHLCMYVYIYIYTHTCRHIHVLCSPNKITNHSQFPWMKRHQLRGWKIPSLKIPSGTTRARSLLLEKDYFKANYLDQIHLRSY